MDRGNGTIDAVTVREGSIEVGVLFFIDGGGGGVPLFSLSFVVDVATNFLNAFIFLPSPTTISSSSSSRPLSSSIDQMRMWLAMEASLASSSLSRRMRYWWWEEEEEKEGVVVVVVLKLILIRLMISFACPTNFSFDSLFSLYPSSPVAPNPKLYTTAEAQGLSWSSEEGDDVLELFSLRRTPSEFIIDVISFTTLEYLLKTLQ